MYKFATFLLVCSIICNIEANIFNYTKIATFFSVKNLIANETGNELWHGLIRDCKRKVSFSCIQKNAYTYLDNAFIERDNITVFDGLVLRKNKLNYNYCDSDDNRIDNVINDNRDDTSEDQSNCNSDENERSFNQEGMTPLEEITSALREKTVKFLATRDYEVQFPEFFFEGANLKISPREIDDNGALIRVDFGKNGVESQGRIFKKIRKFIQNKLLMSFLALMLVIKLIKLKFMFVIPFLFGVGTAKKLFLKLLLFFVPAFAHVFKLCSSYYSSHTKHHHHHHQIAHHHHHVPVPVPIPAVTPVHHSPVFEEEFDGYDYTHPHVQYRKDIEELKQWGIEPNDEPYEEMNQQIRPVYPGPFGGYKPQSSALAHNLAYSGYVNDKNNNRRGSVPLVSTVPDFANPSINVAGVSGIRPNSAINVVTPPVIKTSVNLGKNQANVNRITKTKMSRQIYDDEFYGPIIQRLDDIFLQMGIVEENCKVWMVCRVYKEPQTYTPHSNLVSIELSRDIQELPPENLPSQSSQRFQLYFNAASLGQNHGDCDKSFPCANKV